MKSQTENTQNKYLKKLKNQFDELSREIDDLEERSKSLGSEAKTSFEMKLSALRRKRTEMKDWFSQLGAAGADSWQALKVRAESALSELTQGLSEAKERLELKLTSSPST